MSLSLVKGENRSPNQYSGKYGSDPFKVLLELAALDYERAERSFSHFFRAAWGILEPSTPLLTNWHQDLIAEYLEATFYGDMNKLIINMPPRYSKSLIVTVMFPAWCWLKDPSLRFINASYSEDLATKHNVDRRLLMRSAWYQAAWGSRFQFSDEQNQKTEYTNSARGHMVAAGMLGTITGKGGDFVIIDDPHNPKKAESEKERESAIAAFDSTFTTRLDNKKTGRIVVVMQRLHHKDLTGHLLAKREEGEYWEHLNLPAEAPKNTTIVFPLSKKVLVRETGDILHPEREGAPELAIMKTSLGSYNYEGQYQQNPTPRAGGIFKKSYWRYYTIKPDRFDEVIQSWDLSFKELVSSDPICGFVLGRVGSDIYVLDCEHGQMGFTKTCDAIKRLSLRWPEARKKLIENKANGPAVVEKLKKEIFGLILVEPEGSKIERASICEPILESGNVHLPHESIAAPWVKATITECAQFPLGAHDDRVDALTQGLKYMQKKALDRLRALSSF